MTYDPMEPRRATDADFAPAPVIPVGSEARCHGGEVVLRYADLCLSTFGAIHPTPEDRIALAEHLGLEAARWINDHYGIGLRERVAPVTAGGWTPEQIEAAAQIVHEIWCDDCQTCSGPVEDDRDQAGAVLKAAAETRRCTCVSPTLDPNCPMSQGTGRERVTDDAKTESFDHRVAERVISATDLRQLAEKLHAEAADMRYRETSATHRARSFGIDQAANSIENLLDEHTAKAPTDDLSSCAPENSNTTTGETPSGGER